ncbi:hypothetical protein J132_09189 [Termitomyces sp. J132]|nr:hypothetical protein J132_09189 [Termitomyces sp. J132]
MKMYLTTPIRTVPKNPGRAGAKANEHAAAAAAAQIQRAAVPANDPAAVEVHTLQSRIKKRDKENAALQKRVIELERELQESRAREVSVELVGVSKAIYDPSEVVKRNTRRVDEDEDEEEPKDSLLIDTAYDSDREQTPRSTTPLLSIPRVIRPLPGYSYDQHEPLLQRGATRLMIETFNLEFNQDKGIFAWADSALYKEFAGPKMLKGHFWEIQLGRRFDLDEDDLDGSVFVEGILEDVIMFPGKGGDGAQWETAEESPGIWVTQMVKTARNEEGSEESEEEGDGEADGMEGDREQLEQGIEGIDEDMDEEDELKDTPVFIDDGPVLICPGYDSSDDDALDIEEMEVDVCGAESSDDVYMVDGSSAAIEANVPDDLYDADVTYEVTEVAPQFAVDVNENQVQVNLNEADIDDDLELTTFHYEDSDSADSDFDDDETLSGDEEVLQQSSRFGWWLPQMA